MKFQISRIAVVGSMALFAASGGFAAGKSKPLIKPEIVVEEPQAVTAGREVVLPKSGLGVLLLSNSRVELSDFSYFPADLKAELDRLAKAKKGQVQNDGTKFLESLLSALGLKDHKLVGQISSNATLNKMNLFKLESSGCQPGQFVELMPSEKLALERGYYVVPTSVDIISREKLPENIQAWIKEKYPISNTGAPVNGWFDVAVFDKNQSTYFLFFGQMAMAYQADVVRCKEENCEVIERLAAPAGCD